MKLAILLGLSADKREGVPLTSLLPHDEALRLFKEMNGKDEGPAPFVQIWTAQGVSKTVKFRDTKDLPLPPEKTEFFLVGLDAENFFEVASQEQAEKLSSVLKNLMEGMQELEKLRKGKADFEKLSGEKAAAEKRATDLDAERKKQAEARVAADQRIVALEAELKTLREKAGPATTQDSAVKKEEAPKPK